MIELHICDHGGALLRAFALGDRSEIIIGREEHCDVRINSTCISREHCAIEPEGERLFLRDLDSTGGTLVNGKPVARVQLQDGLEVTIGPAVLRFIENGD